MGTVEKSFIMIKPDGVRKGLIGEIISRFEKRGFKMNEGKLVMPKKEIVKQHYAEHIDKPFFDDLINFIIDGPVFISVWSGKNVVSIARTMLGATNPENAAPGKFLCLYRNHKRRLCY